MHITLGSRQSHLAQKQAHIVKDKLEALGHKVTLFLKPSMGDLNLDFDLSSIESSIKESSIKESSIKENPIESSIKEKGVFTQDFTKLLYEKKIDCVVHSWKDLPIELEGKTCVAATVEREDSRDLFFVKKPSIRKENWKVLTSSPRREHHLKEFFSYLNDKEARLSFKAIRGNIPTRFKKFLEDEEVDGFCVALAAIKRLVKDFEFNKDYPSVWKSLLQKTNWCVLPESFCPSSAAQGALALEVLKERTDLIEVLNRVNHEVDRLAVVKERSTLKSYGGGCHLAIGVQVYTTPYGALKFSSGQYKGKSFKEISFDSIWIYPERIKASELWISSLEVKSSRQSFDVKLDSKKKSILVTRKESFDAIKNQNLESVEEIYTSGLKTWKSLYKKDIWVNGCLDSLGTKLYPRDIFCRGIEEHSWLTRSGVKGPNGFKTYETYSVMSDLLSESFKDKKYFIWMSGEFFLQTIKKYPELKGKTHFLGLGRSFEVVEKKETETGLKKGVHLFPFYNIEQLKKDILKI